MPEIEATPTPTRESELDTRLGRMIESNHDELFDRFDRLHKNGINDDDIILSLRRMNERQMAEDYMEWSGALDPEREDPSTLGGVVPDPADSPSYADHPLNKPVAVALLEEPVRSVVDAIAHAIAKQDAYVDLTDPTEAVIDTTGTRIDLTLVAKEAIKVVYRSVADDTAALSKTLLETMQRIAGDRSVGNHEDVVRYGAYSSEAQTIALGLRKRADEL